MEGPTPPFWMVMLLTFPFIVVMPLVFLLPLVELLLWVVGLDLELK